MAELIAERTSGAAIKAAIGVHRELGPGLLESAYETCLYHALCSDGLRVERQVDVPLTFRGIRLESVYRLDLLVEQCLVVEIKAVERLEPIHQARLLTCLRLTKKRVGLLMNFNVPLLRNGIKRMVL